jgi:hypothetical protein
MDGRFKTNGAYKENQRQIEAFLIKEELIESNFIKLVFF